MAAASPTLLSERTTAVVCADWPVVALTSPTAAPAPAATFTANRVIAANARARQQGVTVGLRRREAQRRAPDLIIHQRDPGAEARTFEVICAALDQVTPRIEVEQAGWCSFATLGPSRYFGGDDQMNAQVADVVADALAASSVATTTVHVGTADTRFAARLAANRSSPGAPVVVAPGASPAFLAPLPIAALRTGSSRVQNANTKADDDLIDVLNRLGLHSLGDFAALTIADVAGRFGQRGLTAHQRASGCEQRLADPREPPPDFVSSMELDPPVERVDQAAFIAKTLADEFCRRLSNLGANCSRVAIAAQTEHGEELVRLWRGDGAFSANAIADRTRWQLDGWLNGSSRTRPTGGLSRLELRPDEVIGATGRQLGFWGEETHGAERAARAIARVQGIIGQGKVSVPEQGGGRSVDQHIVRVPAEAVDLVERASASSLPDQPDGNTYPGRLPPPMPTVVFSSLRPASVLDEHGQSVTVEGRGLLSAPPVQLHTKRGRAGVAIEAWAGPWLIDERWWDQRRQRRRARLQLVTVDGRAQLVVCEQGEWFLEAVYD